ncbi:MAG TPA: PLP-dependent aminotransferase family protein, partial [Thermoanaerobaculia bacterium]|nr:PLP-dependent aminotransferase family protein [Thermoanaerobaculia bacterium]
RMVGWNVPAWDPGELERLILRHRPKLVYSNPTFQNPTGATMEIDTRRELLRLAATHRVPIVEDDTYSLLHWNRPSPPSLRDLDAHNVVLRVGSFSMILGPGVRVGYIIAPRQIMDGLAAMKGAAAGPSDEVSQQAVAELLRGGAITSHLADLRSEHKRRHEALMRSLEAARLAPRDYVSPGGGLYSWIGFPQDGRRVAGAAARVGVGVGAGAKFYLGGKASRHLRICFAATPPDRIEEGVALLSAALKGSDSHGAAGKAESRGNHR